uniref:Uncharacterized protein n=1 Tax=Faecalibaculum rodentium TaxID=1702221 RepID=A0A140DRL2_9FIRM|nr:hypothetical protein AALO17_01550 [Faecalibaculum rodentium]
MKIQADSAGWSFPGYYYQAAFFVSGSPAQQTAAQETG